MSSWPRRPSGKLLWRCGECSQEKTTAFLAAGDLSPRAVFAAFRSWKPPRIVSLIERGGRRACGTCFGWKPTEQFRVIYKLGKPNGRAWICRECRVGLVKKYAERNPEKYRDYQRRSRENQKRKRDIGASVIGKHRRPGTQNIDALRRALVEHPKELISEEERLAYFRGFIAGARRSAEETRRFEQLKDLCHRIAAEGRGGERWYEQRVSWAYEGLLNFIRKPKEFESLEEERKIAAQSIRYYIIDRLRSEGPWGRTGSRHYSNNFLSSHESEDGTALWDKGSLDHDKAGEDDLWKKLEASISEAARGGHVDERLSDILHMRIQGYSMEEIGARFGVTQSRISQVLKNHQGWLADKAAKLLGPRWDEIASRFIGEEESEADLVYPAP